MIKTIPITYITEKIEQQLDIIENSGFPALTEYQLGYISSLNYVLDCIINYNDCAAKTNTSEKPKIKEGFKLFQRKKK